MKENQVVLINKLKEVSDIIPSKDVIKFIKILGEAYKENQITEREIARLQMQREVLLTEIRQKYAFYEKVIEHIFAERKMAIHKSFEIIDRGLESNDRELISSGLHSLIKIVSSSPFSDIQALSNSLENNKLIEI
jgi:hypothetical protein